MSWPKPAVTAVVFNGEGKVLLTRRSEKVLAPNTWCLPGGHLDGGSSWLETLKKEVKEEVGLTVKAHELLGLYSDPEFQMVEDRGEKHYFVTAVFVVTDYDGQVKLNEESVEFGWFGPNELPAPLMRSEFPKLQDAFSSGRGSPFLR